MNRDRFEGRMKQWSGLLRECWGLLTADQSCVLTGRREQLAGKSQERQGIAKQVAAAQLADFLRRNRWWNFSRRSSRP